MNFYFEFFFELLFHLFFSLFYVFFFLSLSLYLQSSNSNELESRFYVLPLTELNLESPANIYTNLVLTNPLEQNIATTLVNSTNETKSTSATSPLAQYQQQTQLIQLNRCQSLNNNNNIDNSNLIGIKTSDAYAQPSMSYTTSSLTTPIKGIIPRLQHEETRGIAIPSRAQSHDDIRMIGSGYNTPPYSMCNSPNLYGSSPIGMSSINSSPPTNCYGSPHLNTPARRALSRAASPLSSSVPSTSYISNANYNKSSSITSRSSAVNTNCSRSES